MTDLTQAVSDLIVQASATLILPRWRKLGTDQIQQKTSATDLVTIADIETEEWLTPRLKSLLPGSQVLGEEAQSKGLVDLQITQSDDPLWIIDPVDGTRSFAQGETGFCCMIALVVGGETQQSWIYFPVAGKLVTAQKGAGAFEADRPLKLNQHQQGFKGNVSATLIDPSIGGDVERLAVRSPADLETIQGHISVWWFPEGKREIIRERVKQNPLPQPYPMQAAGCEYYDLAAGKLDFAVFHRIMPWDHAPGALILSEAGGLAQIFAGQTYNAKLLSGGMIAAGSADIANKVRTHWDLASMAG